MDIKDMTLEQKIGQMIMAGFPSYKFDAHIDKLIKEYNIGNFILFARNIKDCENLYALTEDIQNETTAQFKVPALISIDQEGGMVTRIYDGATFLPGNMAISAAGNANDTYTEGKIAGEELRALGINLNIAPVLDVNNNPLNPVIGVRSYGDDPYRVAELGVNYIKGLQENGVIATAKHFPGHGDTATDSHLALPCVLHSMERLKNIELYPFQKAIENGVDAIMSAHILFPAIESEKLPGTLSYKVLTELLRNKMGFDGLILTDCMEMNAISKYFGTVKASVLAVKAGADIICISHHFDLQCESAKAIKEAVLSGEILESRIDESVCRILKMKEKYGLFKKYGTFKKDLKEVVGIKEHKEFAREISEKSITLIRDKNNLIPIKSNNILSVSPEPVTLTGADDAIIKRNTFCEAVKESIGGEAVRIPVNPDDRLIDDITNKCRYMDVIIIGTYNANLYEGQIKLINSINKVNKNIVVVSLRNPYDIMAFKNISAYLCAYEYTFLSVSSIIKALKGEIFPQGKLPVSLGNIMEL